MNVTDEIKNRLDIVDIVSEHVKLRRSGKNYVGFCPFHANTRTPAFVVFPDSGTWRCFGECNEGGDIFRYVMKKEGWDFPEALRVLAERAGVKLELLTPQKEEQNERALYLQKILEEALVFYRHHLTQSDAGRQVMTYLEERRGIRPETSEAWGLGYAPAGWDAALNYFTNKGYSRQDIIDAGLLTEKPEGGVYDRFRHRIMFPIRDARGGITGFGGRVVDPDDVPKFLNSPQSILFDKGSILYGLDQARKAIRTENQAVIVEGYMDVIVPHQEGFTNVVSPMGTALTEAQMRQLKRFTRRFVLALDADAAGEKATLRGLEVAREALDRSSDVGYDPRGLLHQEARLQADLRVSTLPDGVDPDELVLQHPEKWNEIILNAKPIINHVLDMLTSNQDIQDPKVKSDIAARMLPLIQDVPNPVERDAYRQQVARVLQVDEHALAMLSSTPSRSRQSRQAREGARNPDVMQPAIELDALDNLKNMENLVLAFLCRDPEQLYRMNRFLQKEGLNRLAVDDFSASDRQQVAKVVFTSLTQDSRDPDQYIREELADLLPALDDILPDGVPQAGPSSQQKHQEEIIRIILNIRRQRTNSRIQELRFLQVEEDRQADESQQADFKVLDQEAVNREMMALIKTRGLLDRCLSRPIMVD